ncbi:MAG: hypothetical protein JJU45_16530 [Acidimicrobiia bacterium]|nr:hypothetical protein [Acidimicrobiia bacterium]
MTMTDWRALCHDEPSDLHHEFLVEVAEVLETAGIGVGLRAHLELERFIANADGILSDENALDVGVLQRIIPKIRGFKRDLQPELEDLRKMLDSAGCETCVEVIDRWLDPRVADDEFLDGTDARIGLVGIRT